jgi:hypothetical protein
MDTQARKARIEHMITMEEAFQTCEELPLPERFRKLAKWAAQHLSPAEQEGCTSNGNKSSSVPWKSRLTNQPSQSSKDKPIRGEAMKTYWITAEITRRAFRKIEAESKDEARAMAEQLLEEGAFEGWEEDLPDVIVEEIPEELTK